MSAATTFDTSYPLMAVASEAGAERIAYRHQVALLESLLRPGMTVLDVGCGPKLPYRADHVHVIGLDPSSASLAANTDVDERLCADAAAAIPLPDASVDLVVAFYSIHHVTGATLGETYEMRVRVFEEVARVLKKPGSVLVFEMAPWSLAASAQRLLWPLARRILGARLDTYFWGDDYLGDLGVVVTRFPCSPFALFPPIFSLPWLKIPRFLYPFTPTLYTWSDPA